MIYDIFPMFNEIELLQIRLSELSSVIDKFVIVESDHSFRGLPKPYNFENNIKLFEKYLDKIEYMKVSIKGEENNKNSVVNSETLKNVKDDDVVFFGDLDEIYDKNHVELIEKMLSDNVETITTDQYMYCYRLNGKVFESNGNPFIWTGTVAFRAKLLKRFDPLYIRDKIRGKNDEQHLHIHSGWHFTSLGTNEQILEKFINWTHWSELPRHDLEYVEECVNMGKHFHPIGENLKIIYEKDLDFLPFTIVYSGKINEKFKYLIKEF